MKIRILNGGHALIAYPGGCQGVAFVHEAMADPTIRAFLDKVETSEILPIVPPVPGQDLSDYKALILDRFSNPEVADTERRLCLDGSNRQPKFIIPSIRDNLARGVVPKGLILSSAMWCRYCFGTDESGAEIAPNDPNWDQLTAAAQRARSDPVQWLLQREIYGDLADDPSLVAAFSDALNAVWAEGTVKAMQSYLSS